MLQKLRQTEGEDRWCWRVGLGFVVGEGVGELKLTGSRLEEEGKEVEEGAVVRALALKTFAGGTRFHGVSDTPVERRQERHAQRYVRYFVGSKGM